jgi:hypothetical protein
MFTAQYEMYYNYNHNLRWWVMIFRGASRRPLTAKVRVYSQVFSRGIYGGRSGSGTVLSPRLQFFGCQYKPQKRSILIFFYKMILPEGLKDEAWEPSKVQWSFGNWKPFDRKVLPLSLYRRHQPFLSTIAFQNFILENMMLSQNDNDHSFRSVDPITLFLWSIYVFVVWYLGTR